LSFSYSGGEQIQTTGGKRGPGRPKKQQGPDDCGKTFDTNKKTGSANKARHEQGCSANKAGSANKTGSANKAGMNKDGKRPADNDSGDAHLPREGHKEKAKSLLKLLPVCPMVSCSSFVYA
jgi:hypothetical protein